MDYTSPKYDVYRNHIKLAREKGKSWEELLKGNTDRHNSLENFLEDMRILAYWEIDKEDWLALVEREKVAEETSRELDDISKSTILVDDQTVSDIYVPTLNESAWQRYRARLKMNGFRDSSINEIENSTLQILKKLQQNGKEIRKGLVMGNVQSGKTANMAALMAMAADWGWNMFIILSGTIENLRLQTQNRLLEDLGRDDSTITWRGIEKPSNHSETDKTSDLSFANKSANFTVCLKNKNRLENLINWLQYDQKKKAQMRIIVIDDEADQAGVNTADVTTEDRKTINRLIVNMVNNCRPNGKSRGITTNFKAMNYIGYTATPYANFLNETSDESLYPKNFIATLSNPPEYFGPQAIFGVEGMGDGEEPEQYDGLDIVRIVEKEAVETIKLIHEGDNYSIPDNLKESIAWFLAGTAALRFRGYKKPLSMLIHSSHKQDHHQRIAESVERWIRFNRDNVIAYCERVYNSEKMRLSKTKFKQSIPNYPEVDAINDYPDFQSFESELNRLIDDITHIPLNSDNELEYKETVHLCIDNCANNGIDDEGMFKRLVYPRKEKLREMNYAPAFIVVGGATLSRGLTIEGLISTFFLREGRQADTLMQMGRWFGYRKGYELFPRIWITQNTYNQFRFLSTLDVELRNEIRGMVIRGVQPKEYGPRIKNSPKVKFMRITAKNKMQSAEFTDIDYSGSHNQTVIFEDNKELLRKNIHLTEKFLNSIGKPEASRDNTALIWRSVDHLDVFENFLMEFEFASNNFVFSNIESLFDWVDLITQEEKLDSWNVVVAGIKVKSKNDNLWKIGDNMVAKVNRTRRKTIGNKLDIGVLRAPRDLLADIDYDELDEVQIEKLNNIKDTNYYEKRRAAGLERTPQLLIYRIDANSKANAKQSANSVRSDLNTSEDLIGICITIPGARNSSQYAKTVTVKLDPSFSEDDFEE